MKAPFLLLLAALVVSQAWHQVPTKEFKDREHAASDTSLPQILEDAMSSRETLTDWLLFNASLS
jgi:hypothetical protein